MNPSTRLPDAESRAAPASPPSIGQRVEYAAYRFAAALTGVLPERVADVCGSLLGRFAFHLVPIRRADVLTHLEWAFPDSTPGWRMRTARRAYEHLVREALQTFRLSRLGAAGVRARTEMVGLEALEDALAEGRGAIVLTGHLGNWEIGGASLAARGLPTDVVVQRQSNPLFDAHWTRVRERLGMRTVLANDTGRLGPRSLARGHVLALVADHNLRRGGIFVEWFGRPASTAKGPALFALRSGAPIFLGVSLRRPGRPPRYRVEIVRISTEVDGERDARVRTLTERHVSALEARVKDAPEQYFWMHRRWKTRPDATEPGTTSP